ncbi:MAG: helix-turn-helix domain-containing protein [Sideroxydans sp.]
MTPLGQSTPPPESTIENGGLKLELDFEVPFREARERFDFLYLTHHINHAAGNIAEVADKIGIERTHLYRKLKQLGIKPPKRAGEEKL